MPGAEFPLRWGLIATGLWRREAAKAVGEVLVIVRLVTFLSLKFWVPIFPSAIPA